MPSDLKNFIMWFVILFISIGIADTYFYPQPTDNESQNQIIRPSYNRSFMSRENQ